MSAESRRRAWWGTFNRGVLTLVLAGAATGGVAGVVWKLIVTLPYYSLSAEREATTTERMLTDFVAPDAWFSVIAVVGGLGIGLLGLRFVRLGWPAVVAVFLASTGAALVCWGVGVLMGPNEFAQRLAAAMPGDQVPIDFTLHAPVAVALWPIAAIVPLLLWSSLAPEAEADPDPSQA